MTFRSDTITLAVAAVVLALTPVATTAGPNHKNLGGARGGAVSSVNRGGGGGGGYHRPNGGGGGFANNNRPNSRPNNRPGKGGNIVAGNTVVVGQGGRGGYNNGGRYGNNYDNGNWDNNDNDFLEFVGKTAAITAGVSIVSAVIGSTVNDKPSDCQQSMSNGQVYMNCNGTWYQPVMNGGQQQYQVINPPR